MIKFTQITKRGSLLIFAIWVLVFFSILSASLYKIAFSQISIARALEERLVSQYLAKAAFAYVKRERQVDVTDYDTLYELKTEREREMGNGKFIVNIVDEESKININTAPLDILINLQGMTEDVLISIDESRPFELKEELLLIEGITEDVFAQFQDLITVYGDGVVNINTASDVVLGILGMDAELIRVIKEYRAGPDIAEITEDDEPFDETDSIMSQLRSYTALFQEQQTLLLELSSKKLLGVFSKNYALHINTEILDKPAKQYIIIMDKEKIKRWIEI
jgi:hypothetical protein